MDEECSQVSEWSSTNLRVKLTTTNDITSLGLSANNNVIIFMLPNDELAKLTKNLIYLIEHKEIVINIRQENPKCEKFLKIMAVIPENVFLINAEMTPKNIKISPEIITTTLTASDFSDFVTVFRSHIKLIQDDMSEV